jgi:hypothetical protein
MQRSEVCEDDDDNNDNNIKRLLVDAMYYIYCDLHVQACKFEVWRRLVF